ncbi:MAG: hypothetical protein QGG74_00450 [Phycisphaerales bacterium]|jgi:hypothetical protein|nr:hypothetical protein [Phycisphaerales bacterium]
MLASQITAVLLITVGLSQVLWSGLWADMSSQFIRSRHPAGIGMVGGMVSLILGLVLVLPDRSSDGVLVITIVVGWIMVVKGGAWLLLPGLMLALIPRRTLTIATASVFWGVVSIAAGGVLAGAAFASQPPTSSVGQATAQ